MSKLTENLIRIRNNGSTKQAHIDLANECIKEVNDLERKLAEAREFEKRIKHHCQVYKNTGNAWFNMNRIYKEVEQLKEKGDEQL